jgi:tetratricopeptide (TPR) repeat protein
LIFHIANTLLLFIVLQRMTKALWASAFVAALFAVHPLHIESVAWISERKDVLSTFFGMLTILAYVRYTEKRGSGRYIMAVLLYALGLMAKPMLVTLPFVLLLLDYWPLDRFRAAEGQALRKRALYLVVEKVPFFILSGLICVITVIAQRAGGSVIIFGDRLSLWTRFSNAIISYAAYMGKMLWPSRLAILYPYPKAAAAATVVLYLSILILLSIVFLYSSRRYGFLIVGWLWYIVTLVPVIGIVQSGGQSMADRYTYIPLTGLFIIIAWSIREFTNRHPAIKILPAAAAGIILTALSLCSAVQLTYWRDSYSLFKHTIRVTNNNYVILNSLGNLFREAGKYDEAIGHYKESLRIEPDYYGAYNNLGLALQEKGETEEAVSCFEKAIELTKDRILKPNRRAGFAEAHYNLANLLRQQGHNEQAIEHFRTFLRIRPDDAQMHFNFGSLMQKEGKTDFAIESFRRALEIAPGFEKARIELNAALEDQKSNH